MARMAFKRGEAKLVIFRLTENGKPIQVNEINAIFGVKKSKTESEYVIKKEDADFDKSQANNGILRIFLSESDLNLTPGNYVAELKLSFADGSIDKSADIPFRLDEAVIR